MNAFEKRIFASIARQRGATTRQLYAWYRTGDRQCIDDALRALRDAGEISIANGVWFARQPWLARVAGIDPEVSHG